uniref:Splicing factor 3B subunit 3 n=1 Tax=Romanomermis culicivorax TaxID=13658 RepID=A0A915JI41_ROMCU
MYLYNLTLQRSTAIHNAVLGNFSGTKQQEICVSRGHILEILRPDPNTGKVHTILSHDVFSIIRSLTSFRLTGGVKDYIVVGSDSGRLVILEYNAGKNIFEKIHQETFGKSGCRRIVPGEFLATDPKGRAIMIGACEKQKLVYIMNRDASARLTISSPLEAHKSQTICFCIAGVDVGFENPMFACLEVDYEECDNDPTGDAAQKAQQTLTFYELDLGLNHVVRKYAEPLEDYGNHLISVPGGADGPSGVLICSENYIVYKNLGDQPDIRCPIPRRRNDLDDPERGILIVCSATHKTKNMFFFLVQTEQGDIFKITLETDDDIVTEIKIKYFDTVPVANSMCVMKTGFLFVASEFGNHYLYQIARLGDDDDEPEFSSKIPLDEGDTFFFAPRPLTNLVLVDECESLSPIMTCQIADLANEDTSQIYIASGSGPRSSMKVLRHGLEVSEMAISELPGNPNAVWTVKRNFDEEFDAYIVVSFVNATLVLSIGETVEEVTDSGFLGTTPTLSCSLLGDDAFLQIYPDGIRHIRSDRRVNEWKAPGRRVIQKCAVNQRQVVIALSGGELVYFEMDPTGQLNEYTERKEMSSDVTCMALGNVPSGEQRSRVLAVGLADKTVRIISLDPSDCLTPLSMQALPAVADSLSILEMGGGDDALSTLFLNIGLENGVLLRTVLDSVTGDLSDTRTRYLGTKSVKLFKVKMLGKNALLAMSSRTWLLYYHQNRFHLTPLSYESLEYASSFASEQCPEGVVAISTNTLRILALEKLGAVFNQISYPLNFTPRKFIVHPESSNIIIIETDHNAYTLETKIRRKQQLANEMIEVAGVEEKELATEMAEAFLSENLPESNFGSPKAGAGFWASQIRIVNPVKGDTVALVRFQCQPDAQCLLVGVAKDLRLSPRASQGGTINTYFVSPQGDRLELIHKTPVEDVVHAIVPFRGRAAVGVGKSLRIYDLGKKKLLRKCENKHLPNTIVNLQSQGNRLIVSDVQESVFFVCYKAVENQLIIFADDTCQRYVTSVCILDYDTLAIADKFGNVTVVRLPPGTTDEVQEDPTGVRALWDKGILNGAGQKLEMLTQFFIGETVTTLQKATLIPGGSEILSYTTLSGSIGILVPFTSREDHEFFQHLEMHMRNEMPPLCGRDHLMFRSYYAPVRFTIDGDLCEQYNLLDYGRQKQIAEEMDRQPSEVMKKLEDIRTRHAF